jgi:Flp pilus assembly protein TadG
MIRNALACFKRDTRGVVAIEFGFVCLPLLMFIFGIIEFSRAFWTQEALQQTAITTARCMGLGLSGCSSTSAGQTFAVGAGNQWGLNVQSANVTISSTPATTCGGVTGFVTVSITYSFNTVVPDLIAGLVGTTLSATACFPKGQY